MAAQLFHLHCALTGHLRQRLQGVAGLCAALARACHGDGHGLEDLACGRAFYCGALGRSAQAQERTTRLHDINARSGRHPAHEIHVLAGLFRAAADGLQARLQGFNLCGRLRHAADGEHSSEAPRQAVCSLRH
ncbi:hypothetical protein D3C71_1128000 [compost metagenome]